MSEGAITMTQPKKIDGIDKWEVESAADTLIRAKEIELSEPKLHKATLKLISKKEIAARQAKLDAARASVKPAKNLKEPTVSIQR